MSSILSVSQLNRYIAFKLKEDKNLKSIFIRGEISNFTNHAKTGHLYFTLKDRESAVKAVMFANMAARLNFVPSNGMSVIISANVQVYERDGQYQLYVNDMQPDGIGTVYLAIEQLKEKLLAEGLFDETNKKALPVYPQKIGIVTSVDAAALQDMLNIISRRYPIAEITIFPALVQGENAPASICSALASADAAGQDLIICGRGGGSIEDLSAFNSESVARRIYSCKTPVISAVGHETDTTIADYAADLRAPTPSAAAELAVPDINSLKERLISIEYTLGKRLNERISDKRHTIDIREKQLAALLPKQRIANLNKILEEKNARLLNAMRSVIERKNALIAEKTAAIDNLSPLKIMNRGYSLVYKEKKLVKSAAELKNGDNINIRFSDGFVGAVVETK